MRNNQTPASLIDAEIEHKITGALLKAAKTKNISDMGRKDFAAISDALKTSFSPNAYRKMVEEGAKRMISSVMGEYIAEELWKAGNGWDVSDAEILAMARGIKFGDADNVVLECLDIFREDLPEFTREDLEGRKYVGRFNPLFVAQPDGATLGEIATRKAARGDKLALSFLTWKEIA